MECPYCLGQKVTGEIENKRTESVTQFIGSLYYETPPPHSVSQMIWVHKYIHRTYGFVVELHNCVDLGDWAFNLNGRWPQTPVAFAALEAFIRYAQRGHETRGRKAGFGKAVWALPSFWCKRCGGVRTSLARGIVSIDHCFRF